MKRILFISGFLFIITGLFACGQRAIPVEKPPLPETAVPGPPAGVKEKWEEDWEKARSLAKREGKLIIFLEASAAGAREPIAKAMRNFGIEAEVLALLSGELNRKLLTERKAGLYNADIILTGGGSIANILKPAGVFGNLEENFILPEVKEAKNWREGRMPWFDKDRLLIASSMFVMESVTINNTLVKKEELKSYRDLLDPRWKGKIVMYDQKIPGKAVRVLQGFLDLMGMDYLRQLAKQDILILRDHRQLVEWVGRGKYAIGIALSTDFVEDMKKAGMPLETLIFKEGSSFATGAGIMGIVDRPVHPGASRVFINWFLSREGQTLWSKAVNYVSNRADVPVEHLPLHLIPRPGIRYLQETDETFIVWPELMKLFQEIFG